MMFEEYQICPYTGLRSFTEDESLYFKGREEHIEQATEQLQRNKFLMLTGASGDGKSSLVYAGIVPNARAGFLKSKYTQWGVADFRPERSPFKNLCRSVAKQLGIANPGTVESELQHGFSALVDLYKNSKCYVDVDSVSWQQANEEQRAALKRSAANLIVIVDQFEEFFTNPENYHHGVPSRDSNLVLNVLLETSRIALEEDLPIYVVFTMRSDYIGQCAAFRSLPEYIGFSQFFVPRLNRSQLQLVIEEPAVLSGNQITRRLAERLIHDIAEGVDQLPILQHALNQIWHAANRGSDEMDLVHYAMVGGMAPEELPDEHVNTFKKWFSQLPEKIKACYHEPNLQNVLDTHANKLFESAAESYRSKTGKEITDEAAKEIIKKTFTCLTKIDQSRAVRNRMTLHEIWQILNREDLDIETLGWVISIFREPGNTFIRPFISDDKESGNLREDDVLDITHESLIRNWELLELWAKEEFNNYTTSLDFEQQLNRWVESNKSEGFLLSIGPLTYFENWYNQVKPNAWWIARYLPEDFKQEKKLVNANVILNNAREFIKRSARRHLVTRTLMRYGPRKIAAVIALLALFTFASFMTNDYIKRQNNYILKGVKERVIELSANPNIQLRIRSWLICEELKTGQTTIPEILNQIEDPFERINVANVVAANLVHYGRNEPKKEIDQSLSIADSLLETYPPSVNVGMKMPVIIKEVNDFAKTLELAYFYNPSHKIESLRKKSAVRAGNWAKLILRSKPQNIDDAADLNVALEFAINHKVFDKNELIELIGKMSPFENEEDEWVSSMYHKNKICKKGWYSGIRFNGLYQELAYLYASTGEYKKALQSLDTLLKYNQTYFQNDYAAVADNASHIAAYFYKYGYEKELDEFVNGYCARRKIMVHEFYSYLLARCKVYEFATTVLNLDPRYGHNLNLVLEYSDEDQIRFFFSKYRNALQSLPSTNERNFLTAIAYKDEGIIHTKKLEVQENDSLKSKYVGLFDQAVTLYRTVDQKFLETPASIVDINNNDNITVPNKFLFLWPDIRTPFHPNEPRLFHFFYTSECFLKYILDKNLFTELYPSENEQRLFDILFRDYAQIEPFSAYQVAKRIDYGTLVALEKNLAVHHAEKFANLGLLYLYLAREAGRRGEYDNVLLYSRKLTPEKSKALFINVFDPDHIFRMVGDAASNLAFHGNFGRADSLIKLFNNPVNRSSLYAYAAIEGMKKGTSGVADQLIDSAEVEITRLKNRNIFQPNRIMLSYALAMQDEQKVDAAYGAIKNVEVKFIGIQRICRALGFHAQLYGALENIPDKISDTDYSVFLYHILSGYNESQSSAESNWSKYDLYSEIDFVRYIVYVDDKN